MVILLALPFLNCDGAARLLVAAHKFFPMPAFCQFCDSEMSDWGSHLPTPDSAHTYGEESKCSTVETRWPLVKVVTSVYRGVCGIDRCRSMLCDKKVLVPLGMRCRLTIENYNCE